MDITLHSTLWQLLGPLAYSFLPFRFILLKRLNIMRRRRRRRRRARARARRILISTFFLFSLNHNSTRTEFSKRMSYFVRDYKEVDRIVSYFGCEVKHVIILDTMASGQQTYLPFTATTQLSRSLAPTAVCFIRLLASRGGSTGRALD